MKAIFPAYTSELMRGVWQIWSLWSEELKPKWSAFTPTSCFKRIIYHDWSNLAAPFLPLWGSDSWKPELDEGEESEQTAPWRPRQDRGITQNMLLSSHPTLMDLSWVKDEELSTNSMWNPGLTGCRTSFFQTFHEVVKVPIEGLWGVWYMPFNLTFNPSTFLKDHLW